MLLSLDNVSKAYGGASVFEDINLAVSGGEVVALVGENGAGKSTLMKICAGLLAPSTGHVEWRGRVGYCPQTPGLMDLLTAQEHLDLFDQAPSLTNTGGGDGILTALGFPMTQVRTKLAKDLSGGTRQKLNLALAMLGDADILLLDEPYQGFDQGSYLDFWAFADAWRADGRAVIVVTHLLTELERVDRVVELRSEALVGGRR